MPNGMYGGVRGGLNSPLLDCQKNNFCIEENIGSRIFTVWRYGKLRSKVSGIQEPLCHYGTWCKAITRETLFGILWENSAEPDIMESVNCDNSLIFYL